MSRGLEGRRIAVLGAAGDERAEVQKELTAAGAVVSELPGTGTDEQRWHSGMYAGLVLIGRAPDPDLTRAKQLVQEILVAEKPAAAFGVDAEQLALDESLLAVKGSSDPRAFAAEVVRVFSEKLEEGEVDDASDMSFPASDPPATNPGTAGPVDPHPPGQRP